MRLWEIAYRPYRRPFPVPFRDARGVWPVREGWVLRVRSPDGGIGYGEVAPLPGWGTETPAAAGRFLGRLPAGAPEPSVWNEAAPPACRYALATAVAEAGPRADPTRTAPPPDPAVTAAALLPAGADALPALHRLASAGYRVFKWKIGVRPAPEEGQLWARLLGEAPDGARFRLDANGALDRPATEQWLESAASSGRVEFVEQPLPPGQEPLLLELAARAGVAIALDESVRGAEDLVRWRELGWTGPVVLKPSIAGDPATWQELVRSWPAPVVLSSAFETAIGLQAGLRWAARLHPRVASGFGTDRFFARDGLGLEQPGPLLDGFTDRDTLGAQVWQALTPN